jgi:hypothetical protein
MRVMTRMRVAQDIPPWCSVKKEGKEQRLRLLNYLT